MMPHEHRRAMILTAAVEQANAKGLHTVTTGSVARRCRVKTTPRLVRHYFTMRELWKLVANDPRVNQMVRDDAVALGVVK